MNNNEGTTWWALGLDNSKFESDVNKSNALFQSIGNTAEKEGGRIDNVFRKLTIAAAGFLLLNRLWNMQIRSLRLEVSISS